VISSNIDLLSDDKTAGDDTRGTTLVTPTPPVRRDDDNVAGGDGDVNDEKDGGEYNGGGGKHNGSNPAGTLISTYETIVVNDGQSASWSVVDRGSNQSMTIIMIIMIHYNNMIMVTVMYQYIHHI
jgi:hypothetical protein